VNFRPFAEGDFDLLYAIEETCFQPPHRFSRRYMRQLVSSSSGATWIAEDGGSMAGFAIVSWSPNQGSRTAYIQTIEVTPEMRGLGVGRDLLRLIEQSARQAGANVIWLHVDAENEAAVRLYQSCGYLNQGSEDDYYGSGRHALVFARTLLPLQ